MFANRFTALADACVLVPALNRNLLLSLAEAGFFRLRWSLRILGEAERGIARVLAEHGLPDAAERAGRARASMQTAFEDAVVTEYEGLLPALTALPDPDDAHVVAAAIKTRASVIITDNLRDFPDHVLRPLDLEAKTLDGFVADTIGLDTGRAVASVRKMRERFRKPEKTAATLLLEMDARGLTQTVDALRGHALSL